tara:strand:- start:304 stop:621 length:318 start_codon:yes stop_codon:yes gene_type:complete
MKDNLGNGLCEIQIELLTGLANYEVTYEQRNNTTIVVYHLWTFSKLKTPSKDCQRRTIEAWDLIKSIADDGVIRGVHLDAVKAKISWFTHLTLDEYAELLNEDDN